MASKKQTNAIRTQRDRKAIPHLEQYAPVWLENEQFLTPKDVVIFNVIFQHPAYGWVSRRYRYDSFNDVLYHKGQRLLSEDEALTAQEKPLYIESIHANVPNSYGG